MIILYSESKVSLLVSLFLFIYLFIFTVILPFESKMPYDVTTLPLKRLYM